MTLANWIAIGGILFAQIIGFALWLIGIGTRLSVLEKQMQVFWKDVSFDAAKILHSPHPGHQRMDELIEKYMSDVMNEAEQRELISRLKQKIDNNSLDASTRAAASQMLRAIEQLKLFKN